MKENKQIDKSIISTVVRVKQDSDNSKRRRAAPVCFIPSDAGVPSIREFLKKVNLECINDIPTDVHETEQDVK